MQNENTYIGDDKFENFLNHYQCPTSLLVVKFKFAGAICSPNTSLRPTDVISSLFYEEKQPRLITKKEAELFFKFFMGLWDKMFMDVRNNKLEFPKISKQEKEKLEKILLERSEAVENGFVEGFWGGLTELKIPNFAAQLVSSLTDMAGVYKMLAHKLRKSSDADDIFQIVLNTDKTVMKTIHFLIEHYVLPRINEYTTEKIN